MKLSDFPCPYQLIVNQLLQWFVLMEFINLISNCLLQLVNIINSGYPENLSMAGEAMEIMDPETGAMVKQIISNTSGSSGCKE